MSLQKAQCLQTKVSKLYDNYISKGSVNYKQIPKVIFSFNKTNHYVTALFCECLLQLLKSSGKIKTDVSSFYFKAYLEDKILLGESQFLLDSIIKRSPLKTLYKFSKLIPKFKLTFVPYEDTLGLIYQTVIQLLNTDNGQRYYTPEYLSDLCVSTLNVNENRVFLDPCCSSGSFLLRLLKRGANEQNLYGCDLDEFSITLARINLWLNVDALTEEFLKKHIKKADGITYICEKQPDVVISNPPYSVVENDKDCLKYQNKLKCAARKRPFLADLFVERYLKVLNTDGIIQFILPEAILSVASHSIVRLVIENMARVKAVRYLGDVFHDVQSNSIVLTLEKSAFKKPKGEVIVNFKDRSYVIRRDRDPSDFNFRLQDSEATILSTIDNAKNAVFLKDKATFVMGVVTGANEEKLQSISTDNNEPIIRGVDVHKFCIDEPSRFVSKDYLNFQQIAPVSLYREKVKIVYRFISRYPICAIDESSALTLNSANFFILNTDDLNPDYVCAILNSSLMKFYFEKKFTSLKVLRSYLEQIPIVIASPLVIDKIVGLVLQLKKINKELSNIRKSLDNKDAIDSDIKYKQLDEQKAQLVIKIDALVKQIYNIE